MTTWGEILFGLGALLIIILIPSPSMWSRRGLKIVLYFSLESSTSFRELRRHVVPGQCTTAVAKIRLVSKPRRPSPSTKATLRQTAFDSTEACDLIERSLQFLEGATPNKRTTSKRWVCSQSVANLVAFNQPTGGSQWLRSIREHSI